MSRNRASYAYLHSENVENKALGRLSLIHEPIEDDQAGS